MKKLIYEKWFEEYNSELKELFSTLNSILKNKNMVYKEYQFDTFCKLIYSKSSKYG
jgi:hypothetical protein